MTYMFILKCALKLVPKKNILHYFGLDLVTTTFYPASFDLKIASILHQTMVTAATIRTDLDGF